MRTKRKAAAKKALGNQKTLALNKEVYDRLVRLAGRRDLSRFVASLIPPGPSRAELEAGYKAMAADSAGEAEALEWVEALIGDIADETR